MALTWTLEHVGNTNKLNTRTVCFNFVWLIWGIYSGKKDLIWCKGSPSPLFCSIFELNWSNFLRFFFSIRDVWNYEVTLLPLIPHSPKPAGSVLFSSLCFLSVVPTSASSPSAPQSLRRKKWQNQDEGSGNIPIAVLLKWSYPVLTLGCLQIIGWGSWLLCKPWRRCTMRNSLIWVRWVKCFGEHFLCSETTFLNFSLCGECVNGIHYHLVVIIHGNAGILRRKCMFWT